jgi:phospholipid/cholesterol/gamma-HCH transport system substrate-binding protein
MSQRANYSKIGLFVIIGTVLLVLGLIALGAGSMFKKTVLVETYVDETVQGLNIGSPIKYRGVQYGSVKEIALVNQYYDPKNDEFSRYVLIRCEMDAEHFDKSDMDGLEARVDGEVKKGMRIRLSSQGITGLMYLEVDFFEPERYPPLGIDWDPDVVYIPSTPSRLATIADSIEKVAVGLEKSNIAEIAKKVDRLIQVVTDSVEDAGIKNIGENANGLMEEIRATNKRVQDILAKPEVDTIPKQVSDNLDKINKILEDSRSDVQVAMDNLRQTSETFQKIVNEVDESVEKEKMDKALDDLYVMADNARTSSEEWPETTATLKRSLRRLEMAIGNQQEDLQIIVQNLKIISDNMVEITENLRQYPIDYLLSEPPNPPEEK